MPPDVKVTPVSRTMGEMIFSFTHTVQMDWMLPGVAPTGKRVAIPLVAIIGFKDGKVQHEHIYWDQASVLVQPGMLDAKASRPAGAGLATTEIELVDARKGCSRRARVEQEDAVSRRAVPD